MNKYMERIKEAAKKKKKKKEDDDIACETPGKKIRSKGKGRGLAIGRGHGPLGIPISEKAMAGKEKTAFDAAYEEGVKLALAEYLKTARGMFNPGGGVGSLMGKGTPQTIQTQAVAGPMASREQSGFMPGPKPMRMPAPQMQATPKPKPQPAAVATGNIGRPGPA